MRWIPSGGAGDWGLGDLSLQWPSRSRNGFQKNVIAKKTDDTCSENVYLMSRNNTKGRQPTALSPQEWKLMDLLWAKSPQPAYDLIEALAPREKWHPNTVRTMLARLLQKRVVRAEQYKNLYLYSPVLGREELVSAECSSLLERVFGGALRPALIHFVKKQRLTPAEVEEMKRILDETADQPRS